MRLHLAQTLNRDGIDLSIGIRVRERGGGFYPSPLCIFFLRRHRQGSIKGYIEFEHPSTWSWNLVDSAY
jgi:hypothetical protein